MESFLLITDIFLLLFWVRLWSRPDKELYFNPFLSAPTRLTDRVLDFLRPVLPLPDRLTALLLLAFFLVFRAVTLQHFLAEEPWVITLGAVFPFSPREPGMSGAMVFSALHFLFFVARFWGVYLIIQLLTPIPRRDRASQAFAFAALPLAALRRWAQLLVLLAVHGLLVYELSLAGILNLPATHPLAMTATGMANGRLIHLACLSLISVADALMMAWQLMFALLISSFLAAMMQNGALLAISNEGVSTMLGCWRQRLIVGFLDLTPLLYMASAYLLYNVVLLPCLFAIMTGNR
ncbi:MAG: hypothetical protein WCR06_08285 [bacterium]